MASFLIYRERLSYPWLADVAALDRDFTYDRYQAEARRCHYRRPHNSVAERQHRGG